jgi:hypothetical protein
MRDCEIGHDEGRTTIMPSAVEIQMTSRGFVVTMRGRTAAFPRIDDAFDFAQKRLEEAWQVRELSRRCE